MSKTADSHTDLRRFLENLRRLFETGLDTLSELGRSSIRLSMAVEARLLADKLAQTARRLPHHPPFLEFIDVDFSHWGDQVNRWQEYMAGHALTEELIDYERFSPGDNFFVDLYDARKEGGVTSVRYAAQNVDAYLRSGVVARGEISQSRTRYMQSFEQAAVQKLGQDGADTPGGLLRVQSDNVTRLCCDQLRELSMLLYRIDAILNDDFSPMAYANLYDRTVRQRAKSVTSQADTLVRERLSGLQPGDLPGKAEAQIEVFRDRLSSEPLYDPLRVQLRFSEPLSLQHAAMGRFLFMNRKTFSGSMASLLNLVYTLTVIELLQPIANGSMSRSPEATLMDSPLPPCFTEKLRSNPAATMRFIERLRHLREYINTGKQERSGDPRWGHLSVAFESVCLQVMERNVSPIDFGSAMHAFFPDEKEETIAQGLRPDRYSTAGAGETIINNLITYFSPIWEGVDGTYADIPLSWPSLRDKKKLVKL